MATIIESVQRHIYYVYLRAMNKSNLSQATGVSKSITNTVYDHLQPSEPLKSNAFASKLTVIFFVYVNKSSVTIFQSLYASKLSLLIILHSLQLRDTLYTEKSEGGGRGDDTVLSLYFNLARPLLDTNIIQLGIVSWHPSGVRFARTAGVRGLRCLFYYSVSIPLSLSLSFLFPLFLSFFPFSPLLSLSPLPHPLSRFIPNSHRDQPSPLHNPWKIIKYCPMKYLDIYLDRNRGEAVHKEAATYPGDILARISRTWWRAPFCSSDFRMGSKSCKICSWYVDVSCFFFSFRFPFLWFDVVVKFQFSAKSL